MRIAIDKDLATEARAFAANNALTLRSPVNNALDLYLNAVAGPATVIQLVDGGVSSVQSLYPGRGVVVIDWDASEEDASHTFEGELCEAVFISPFPLTYDIREKLVEYEEE